MVKHPTGNWGIWVQVLVRVSITCPNGRLSEKRKKADRLQKNAKAAAAADYPAYGVTGPSKEEDMTSPPNGDRKLAQNAHMYHYQHQKQQMIAIEKANGDRQASTSDLDSEEENEDGDYTVYECAGLAPTGEMEVKNPLFQDEPPPPTPPVITKDLEK
uniref:Neural proliferation differentiation and control protein 1 n=1 Tax=Strigamia maritima TaxID=126957 RepID=T1J7I1_STRMM